MAKKKKMTKAERKEARLRKGKQWLLTYTGSPKKMNKHYRERFHVVKPKLGEHQPNNPKLVYTMDFQVTPHQLRHTYITNLIYASVDPKTVQYLAGHENSKVTMDIYAKVKYNKPAQLHGVINRAIDTSKKIRVKIRQKPAKLWV